MLSRYLLVCSIISSVLVLLVQIFRWQIVEAFTPFFFPFILTAVYGFFIITLITSVILMIVKRKWKPVVIQIVTIILFFTVPFNQMILKWNFYMKKEAREEVIEKIDNGDLKPNVDYNDSLIQLPNEYAHVTSGGNDIVVEEDGAVFFFTYRGVLDNFSGIAHSPLDEKPATHDFGGDFKEIVKFADGWYFVSSS